MYMLQINLKIDMSMFHDKFLSTGGIYRNAQSPDLYHTSFVDDHERNFIKPIIPGA